MRASESTRIGWVYCIIAAAVMIAGGGYAFAAEEAAEVVEEEVSRGPGRIEEVIVTARKREESLQDVSVAVTALPDAILKDNNLTRAEEIVTLVPSLNLQKGGNARQSSFNIRGIGTQSYSTGVEPSVATMLDGVVLGRSGMAFQQLLDIQRVEVLRGPQGTLFGKNASGGVIHFITRDPSESHEGEVSVTGFEKNEYNVAATLSGPIVDTLGYRLSFTTTSDEGYTKNVYNGEYLNGNGGEFGNEWGVRGKLRWQPLDILELKWISDYNSQKLEGAVPTVRHAADSVLDELLPVVPSPDNTEVNLDGEIRDEIQSWGHSLEINWDIGDFTLTSISAYREWEQGAITDNDGRPTNPLTFEQFGFSQQRQITEELRLASPADAFVTYVVGLFYFNQRMERQFQRSVFSLPPTVADMKVDTENAAAFGELSFHLAESFRLIGGARFTYDKLGYEFERTGFLSPGPQPPIAGDTDDDDLSLKLAVEWDIASDAMTYASYSQGYKGQAYNMSFGSAPENLDPVKPETVDAFEVGLKSNWFDDRLRLNIALFYAEYEGFQAQSIIELGDTPVFVLTNVGEVSTKGVEIDFMAIPIENLSLSGGFAWIDAKIDEYEFGPCSFGQKERGECPLGYQDLSGGDLPNSPNWKFNLSANYIVPLSKPPFDLVLKGNYRIQDDVLYDISQDPYTIQEGYGVLDLALALENKEGRYSVSAFVKNVLDERYAASITANSPVLLPGGYMQQLPKFSERTFGFELRYSWF